MPQSDHLCGATVGTTGEKCVYPAKYPDGKCGVHSEHNAEERKKGGNPAKPGEVRSYKHGLYMERSRYYQFLEDEEKEVIKSLFESFLHEAPFDESAVGKCQLLWQVCVDIHMKSRAQDYVAKEGMTQKKTKGFAGDVPIKEPEENTLFITADRLSRGSVKTLKELGILDPQKSEMRKNNTLVDILSGVAGKKDE